MGAILTVTLNPAIDVATSVERLEPTRKLRCAEERRDAGGGGLNVARVVQRFGGEALAAYTAGGLAGEMLQRLIAAEGVHSVVLPVSGDTRENFNILERASGREFRFIMPGPRLNEAEWSACVERIATLERNFATTVLSGSLPRGAPEDAYAQIARVAKAAGARVIVDAAGAQLRAALSEGVFLVKPNIEELRDLTGLPLQTAAERAGAARELISSGGAEIVALSLGAEGALLVTPERAWRADAPPVEAISSIGAGDSFVAALAWALEAGHAIEDAFRYGMAAGAAALLTPGTELCRREDAARLLPAVRLEPV